jgi:hypothetical protein
MNPQPYQRQTGTLPATTHILHVGVVERETLVQAFFCVVEFRTVEIHKTLGVDQDLDTLVFKHHVIILDVIRIFHHVGHAGTAGGLHGKPQSNTLAALFHERLDPVCGGLCQCNTHA